MYNLFTIEITINSNFTENGNEYPTIEADPHALEGLSHKGISNKYSPANTPKQFGCDSYCRNQGVCVIVAQSVTCRCPTGYTGLQCQVARKIEKNRARMSFYILF